VMSSPRIRAYSRIPRSEAAFSYTAGTEENRGNRGEGPAAVGRHGVGPGPQTAPGRPRQPPVEAAATGRAGRGRRPFVIMQPPSPVITKSN
jgi:hypothetical protein